jgi:thiamine biosynthesis lipoprotein
MRCTSADRGQQAGERAGLALLPALTRAEPVMGTVVSFLVPRGVARPAGVGAVLDAACADLHRIDAIFTTWDDASPVSRLRRGAAGLADMPPEVAEVLCLCRAARQASGGWFDPWAMPGGVDPTGLVKGWGVERAAGLLRQAGVAAAMVNGGGDVTVFGSPGPAQPYWRIGVRHPWRQDALAAVLLVAGAVATSASYERGCHLIDPATAAPASRAASATVTGPSLAVADALATALAVGGDDALTAIGEVEGYAGYLIRPDGTETSTPGIVFA